jgi:hypothetical protein
MWDSIALWIIVLQGFFVVWFEYDVWRMNKDRFKERASWREQKRKQAAKKLDGTPGGPSAI